MDAGAWRNKSTYGIRVGKDNRDRFFDDTWDHVEVEMDGVSRRFALTDSFWRDCTEFRDSGMTWIKDWLAIHYGLPWPKGHPSRFELIPLGGDRFELRP